LFEVFSSFLKLGLISFGGPVAHLSYFREEFVTKRRWLDDEAYADLVALCQFLPGPASSQVVFALGKLRAGLMGALLASVCFTMPSAVLMILFGYGVTAIGDLRQAGWLHGLKLAAVAVVAQAVWGMGQKLCPDRARFTLALVAAAFILVIPHAVSQVAVIVIGALAGWWLYRGDIQTGTVVEAGMHRGHVGAVVTLMMVAVLLVVLPVIAKTTGQKSIAVFDSFFRAGSLVFGGGHVVLPLLRAEVVPPGWVGDDAFLAGYGAAQAMPGPLFTFSSYLGTVIQLDCAPWIGGLWCLLAIFLPAWMLIGGALPFWHVLRGKVWTQAALRGANAAVVGVLLAAFYNPVWTEGVVHAKDVATVFVAFAMLTLWRIPPWLVVVFCAVVGQWVLL
jgi:chromate transporter